MIRTKHSKRSFPFSKLPQDIIENIIRFSIKNTSTTLKGSQLIFVNRLFAKTSIPHIWKHLYLREPSQRIIFSILSTPSEELMFDYKSLVRRITICPISISYMNSGGLLKTLEIVRNFFTSPLVAVSIEDKLSFCHVCHVGKEITWNQVASELLVWKGLKELTLDSNHSAFNDELLGVLLPNFAPFVDRQRRIHGGLQKISLSGVNFTDQGILQYVIPYAKDTLVEFSAGYKGVNPTNNITGLSILELLKNCKNLSRIYLEGVALSDSDFVKHLTMTNDDDLSAYCDELLGDNLSDFDYDDDMVYNSSSSSPNSSLILSHPSPTTSVQQHPSAQIEYLYLGKTNPSTFTHLGLQSLLSLCHKSLQTLVIDIDYISQSVLLDVIIPLFSCTKLQEIHLISESWYEWALHYPRPRYEFEIQAKEAMWRWKLKAYWELSNELINHVGDKIESLRVFSILGENYLGKSL
ncbi:6764_t:CDS:1 [Funneliformis caledonium]|uniref:6764_t:CDS:1 n=1 Tax=Funneliformis caledonium TaxID=1117310 RepID=A0A9N8WLZ8_9GLOM|nr:6764_t:CDS:1 [Funneliformis caledonium]